ncbi:MAG TPA: LysR family transcriptional regulator [Stellaceae bacterium]|nr:LysR family transcriptional regulator [Stellaceae bacterium]
MNLRAVDLNLLVALDALLAERHVTRAAERVGLSQPAMSNALGRLRHLFADEILVRTATGMQPTPRARALAGATRQLLRQVEHLLEPDAGYDPSESERRFSIRMSDLLGLLLLPGLLERLRTQAPRVGLDVLHLPPARTVDALEADEIDLAVSTGLEHGGSIRAEPLFADRMVCLMRSAHPLARGRLSLEAFLAQRHLRVAQSPTDQRFADDVLGRLERKRDIALNLPHWLLVPHVLRRTDLVAVMPGRLAEAIAGRSLVAREFPFAPDRFHWTLYWHRRYDGNAASEWLRREIRAAAKPYG